MNNKYLSYEDLSDEIDMLLFKFRPKWQLKLAHIEFDDICQIIRMHIFKKWDKWDQSRPFAPWCSRLIHHQILNLIRDNYGNFTRPCLRCPHYGGAENCTLTKRGLTDSSCPEFAKWEKKKKSAFYIKMPDSINSNEEYKEPKDLDFHKINYSRSQENLNMKMKKLLSSIEWCVYSMAYIENKSDDYIAKKMNYTGEENKSGKMKYKQLDKLKRKFILVAKRIMDKYDIINEF